MTDTEKIIKLEEENKRLLKKQIELLEKIIELQNRPPKIEYIPYPNPNPTYPNPNPTYPTNPFPWITWTDDKTGDWKGPWATGTITINGKPEGVSTNPPVVTHPIGDLKDYSFETTVSNNVPKDGYISEKAFNLSYNDIMDALGKVANGQM